MSERGTGMRTKGITGPSGPAKGRDEMFWRERLKNDDGTSSWMLSYGDVMSLLLAVFVMIAAMSDLKDGPQFTTVRDAVRSAFGFAVSQDPPGAAPEAARRPMTLVERLEQAGLRDGGRSAGGASGYGALACCDVVLERDRLVIRVAGPVAFDAHSATVNPEADRALMRLADFLAGGQAQLEVRGHNGDGPLPATAPYRDIWDLSYERARAAADTLVQAGVQRERLHISAWGDGEPLVTGSSALSRQGANRRIEIVVHAVPATAIVRSDGGT